MKTTLGKITDAVKGAFAGAKTAFSDIHNAVAALCQELERLGAERSKLIALPPPGPDLLKELDRDIAGLGRQWLDSRAPALVACLAGEVLVDAGGRVLGVKRHSNISEVMGALDLGLLCAVVPDEVRKALGAAIERIPYEAGPPMDQRVALLAEVDEAIARVEAEHQALVDSAAEVGIVLDELPVNRARRMQRQQAEEHKARVAREEKLKYPVEASRD